MLSYFKRTLLTGLMLISGVFTAVGQMQIIQDSSFEAGHNNHWIEHSKNFTYTICDASCTQLSTVVPFDSLHFALLGGSKNILEESSVEQYLVIPVASYAVLEFYLKTPIVAANFDDYFMVYIDSNSIFSINATDSSTYKMEYKKVSVDITNYADGQQHKLKFYGYQTGVPRVTYYLVDNATIKVTTGYSNPSFASEMSIFPNPATTEVTIRGLTADNYKITVNGIDGRLLYFNEIKNGTAITLDLSGFKSGLYFVNIENPKGIKISRKLIVR